MCVCVCVLCKVTHYADINDDDNDNVNKQKTENLLSGGFCHPRWPRCKNKRKKARKLDKFLDLAGELKKLWNIGWWWYQLYSVHLEWFPKTWTGDWKIWKTEEESGPSSLQHCWEWPEYWEESWWPGETWSDSSFSESPSVNTGVKNLQGVK